MKEMKKGISDGEMKEKGKRKMRNGKGEMERGGERGGERWRERWGRERWRRERWRRERWRKVEMERGRDGGGEMERGREVAEGIDEEGERWRG